MGIALTIAIPVGPKGRHREFLNDCVWSIAMQMSEDDNILLMYEFSHIADIVPESSNIVKIIVPANLGVAAMVNLSVGYATREHVLLMNSDDKLLPGALESVRETWEQYQDPQGWYYLNTRFSDGREEQHTPSGVAMVCRSHFLELGGYPPESAVGFPDWMFLSLMQARGLIKTYPVSDACLHWHRVYDQQETRLRQNEWEEVAKAVHDTLQRTWEK